MAPPGKLFISRAEQHNRVRANIAEAVRLHVANGDGTFMEWLLTTPHIQNGVADPSFCFFDEIYHVQGVQRGRMYRGAFYDWTQRQSAGGTHAPAAYSDKAFTGSRVYGHTEPAGRDWMRWAVPAGMTHVRIWAVLYDTANPCDLSIIQQNAAGATLANAGMAHDAARLHYRPSAWISLAEGASFIKALNAAANTAADFIIVGVQFIDRNTLVDPDVVGACMFDSVGGSGVNTVLSFPDPNGPGWSSSQLACYHQAHGVAYPTTEPNGSASPQFGGCSHKGTYGGVASIRVDDGIWNSRTDPPVRGDRIVMAYATNVSSDYIRAPGYATIYRVAELEVAMTWNKWEVDIARTLFNSEAAARDIFELWSVLLSVPYSMTQVSYGGRAPQALGGAGGVYGILGDRVMRIGGGPLGVVIIGEHTVGRDVGAGGTPPQMINAGTFFRGYIRYAGSTEAGAPYVLGPGERIDWSARYTIVNEADEERLHASVGDGAANLYQKSIDVGPDFTVLAAGPLVLDATIIAGGGNTDDVTVRITSGGDVVDASWPPGAVVHLRDVDLSTISVAGPNGNRLLVVGQAP